MKQTVTGRQATCANIIRRSCCAKWINKATDTHTICNNKYLSMTTMFT